MHPQKAVQQLEQVLNRLDHFAGQLYRHNPVAMAKVSAAIKACWDCPLEQKVEASFRLLVGLGLAPHAASKGIGLVAQVVQDADLLGKAGTVARKIGTGAAKLADGLAEGKVAVTPEGVKIPVQMASEGEAVEAMENEHAQVGGQLAREAEKTAAEVKSPASGVQVTPAVKTEPAQVHVKTDAAIEGPYSGELIKIPKPDAGADALATKLKGQSTAFSNDPIRKEFDVISNEFIAETKEAMCSSKPAFRNQAKRAFEAARQTNRKVYFHFNGMPCRDVIRNFMSIKNGMALR